MTLAADFFRNFFAVASFLRSRQRFDDFEQGLAGRSRESAVSIAHLIEDHRVFDPKLRKVIFSHSGYILTTKKERDKSTKDGYARPSHTRAF